MSDFRYIGRGEKMILSTSDGVIYLIDGYKLTEEILMDFYGEVS